MELFNCSQVSELELSKFGFQKLKNAQGAFLQLRGVWRFKAKAFVHNSSGKVYTFNDGGLEMPRPNILNEIRERIAAADPDAVFVSSDFQDLASLATANRALLRLQAEGFLRKAMRGVYYRAVFSKFLEDWCSPDLEKVMEALARKHGWSIAPSGLFSLNFLGLSTQVPMQTTYVSDGPSCEYHFGICTVRFKHVRPQNIQNLSPLSAMTVQAIFCLGKGQMTSQERARLRRCFDDEGLQRLLRETRHCSAWIYEEIRKLAEVEVAA